MLNKLNENNINYCILRNWNNFNKGDIDILLTKKDIFKVRAIFIAEKYIEISQENYSLSFKKICNNKIVSYHFHIQNLIYNNIVLYSGRKILRNKLKYKNFFIPWKEDYLIELLIHSIVHKQSFNRYAKIIMKIWKNFTPENKNGVIQSMINEYGSELADLLIQIIEDEDFSISTIKELKLRIIDKKTNIFGKSRLLYYLIKHQIQRVLPKKKIVISFIGTDGVGKTTMCNELKSIFKNMDIKTRKINLGIYHRRTMFMQVLGYFYNLFYHQTKKEKKYKINYNFEKKATLKNTIRLIDILIRYMKGFFGKERVIITDRSFIDIVLQSKPDKFSLFLLKLLPKPPFLFYLYCSPELAWKRKKERSAMLLMAQNAQLEKFLKELNMKYIKIDTGENVEKSMDEIINKLNNTKFLRITK